MSWVLVVDDEASVTRLIQLRLEAEGYDVDVAPNGSAALEKLGAIDQHRKSFKPVKRILGID